MRQLRFPLTDAKEVIEALQLLHKKVLIMTGNFYPAVNYVAKYLGIESENVYANRIIFDEQGNYLTFDNKGPLSVAGGKRSLMMILERESQKVVFVGDGSTDADTRPPVDLFIGFGGVIVRQNVKKIADIYITSKSMVTILPYILTSEETKKIMKSKFKKLLLKANKLVQKGYALSSRMQSSSGSREMRIQGSSRMAQGSSSAKPKST